MAFSAFTEGIEHPSYRDMSKISEACEDDIRERFNTAGRGSWKPNSPKTIRSKHSNSPLVDTGTMRDSVRHEIYDDHIRVSVPYGGRKHNTSVPVKHQYGLSFMPQRKIVDVSSKELNLVLMNTMREIIQDLCTNK